MHPNIPPQLMNESGQYYYPALVQQSTMPYGNYPNQACFYPPLDQHYMAGTPQRQPSHLVMPVAQHSPVIIVASPAGTVYPPHFFPPGQQTMYYQDLSHQQSQMVYPSSSTRSSVRPLLTSTPLPMHADYYNTSGASHSSNGSIRGRDRRPALDILEEVSKITDDDDEMIVAPLSAQYRNQLNFRQRRGQYDHKTTRTPETYDRQYHQQPRVHFDNATVRRPSRNWNERRAEPGRSLLKSRHISGSMGCLSSAGLSSGRDMQPNRGMLGSFPAKSVIGLNNFAEASHSHVAQAQHEQIHFTKRFMNGDTFGPRRAVSTMNLAGPNHTPNEQFAQARREELNFPKSFMHQNTLGQRRTVSTMDLAGFRHTPNEQFRSKLR